VARRESGEVRRWPVVETIQVNSICDEVIAPAQDLDPAIAAAGAGARAAREDREFLADENARKLP